ncbi:MAG: hypothetical protein ABID45_00470, partial [Patescibacteria group bacterium]
KLFLSIFILMFVFTLPVFAEELNLDTSEVIDIKNTEPAKTTIEFGDTVNITGNYDNDIIAFGNNITIQGDINGDILAAGANITIKGTVNGDVRAAGGNINIEGDINKNATLTGGYINVNSSATIGKDLVVWGGQNFIDGTVKGNVFGSTGNSEINGTVDQNVDLDTGTFSLGKDAVINGDLTYSCGQEADINTKAIINGATYASSSDSTTIETNKSTESWSKTIGWKLIWWLSYLLIGLIFIQLFPKCLKETSKHMFNEPGPSILWGLLFIFVTPLLLLLLIITVIGLPLGILGFIFYGVSIYISSILMGIILGDKILPKQKHPYIPMVAGITIIYVLKLIPVIGGLIGLLAAVWILGAYIIKLKKEKKKKKK